MIRLMSDRDWAHLAEGRVRIGSAPPDVIRMSRWHWITLEFLQTQAGLDVSTTLATMRKMASGVSSEQLVIWYVESALETLLDEEAASDTAST